MSDPWEMLWDHAMLALDSLKPGFRTDVVWSFGGGTAMRLFYDHRESKDIDIFVTDPYVISGLSPRLNDQTATLTDDYEEQSTYLKLRFPPGEVDFILSGKLIADVPFAKREIRGRIADVETPIEIVAKKCFYRAADFTARDIFDLAVLIDKEPENVEAHEGILLGKRDDLRRRFGLIRGTRESDGQTAFKVSKMRDRIQAGIDAIDAMPEYAGLKKTALDAVIRFIERDEPGERER